MQHVQLRHDWLTHRIHVCYIYIIYGNIYHQYTPFMLAYIPYMDPMASEGTRLAAPGCPSLSIRLEAGDPGDGYLVAYETTIFWGNIQQL